MPPRVVAIVIAYRPDAATFTELLLATAAQTDRVLVVDNGQDPTLAATIDALGLPSVDYLPQNANLGIAAAQNTGIVRARTLNADYVLLLDHDSVPAPDMVVRLIEAYGDLQTVGHKVAAVGPRIYDANRTDTDTRSSFVRIEGMRLARVAPEDGQTVPVSYLIASGSLIALATLDAVSGMAADLFIEYVDIEWSLRAASKGYVSHGVWDARMRHSQGEQPIRILGQAYVRHGPQRNYYMFRNLVWLCRQDWMKPGWRLALCWNGLQRFVVYMLFAGEAGLRLRYIARGLRDGWHGCLGLITSKH